MMRSIVFAALTSLVLGCSADLSDIAGEYDPDGSYNLPDGVDTSSPVNIEDTVSYDTTVPDIHQVVDKVDVVDDVMVLSDATVVPDVVTGDMEPGWRQICFEDGQCDGKERCGYDHTCKDPLLSLDGGGCIGFFYHGWDCVEVSHLATFSSQVGTASGVAPGGDTVLATSVLGPGSVLSGFGESRTGTISHLGGLVPSLETW